MSIGLTGSRQSPGYQLATGQPGAAGTSGATCAWAGLAGLATALSHKSGLTVCIQSGFLHRKEARGIKPGLMQRSPDPTASGCTWERKRRQPNTKPEERRASNHVKQITLADGGWMAGYERWKPQALSGCELGLWELGCEKTCGAHAAPKSICAMSTPIRTAPCWTRK